MQNKQKLVTWRGILYNDNANVPVGKVNLNKIVMKRKNLCRMGSSERIWTLFHEWILFSSDAKFD